MQTSFMMGTLLKGGGGGTVENTVFFMGGENYCNFFFIRDEATKVFQTINVKSNKMERRKRWERFVGRRWNES